MACSKTQSLYPYTKKNQVQTANFIFPDPNKKNQTVRISIPDATVKIPEENDKQRRFLYYYFSCLCKYIKQRLFVLPQLHFWSESGCKGTTIFRTAKTFPRKFSKISENLSGIDLSQTKIKGFSGYTLLYYINGKWKMENGKWKMKNGKWKIVGAFLIAGLTHNLIRLFL